MQLIKKKWDRLNNNCSPFLWAGGANVAYCDNVLPYGDQKMEKVHATDKKEMGYCRSKNNCSFVLSGHVKILLWMGSKGSVSHVDNLGGTPLHDAAEQGEFEVGAVNE